MKSLRKLFLIYGLIVLPAIASFLSDTDSDKSEVSYLAPANIPAHELISKEGAESKKRPSGIYKIDIKPENIPTEFQHSEPKAIGELNPTSNLREFFLSSFGKLKEKYSQLEKFDKTIHEISELIFDENPGNLASKTLLRFGHKSEEFQKFLFKILDQMSKESILTTNDHHLFRNQFSLAFVKLNGLFSNVKALTEMFSAHWTQVNFDKGIDETIYTALLQFGYGSFFGDSDENTEIFKNLLTPVSKTHASKVSKPMLIDIITTTYLDQFITLDQDVFPNDIDTRQIIDHSELTRLKSFLIDSRKAHEAHSSMKTITQKIIQTRQVEFYPLLNRLSEIDTLNFKTLNPDQVIKLYESQIQYEPHMLQEIMKMHDLRILEHKDITVLLQFYKKRMTQLKRSHTLIQSSKHKLNTFWAERQYTEEITVNDLRRDIEIFIATNGKTRSPLISEIKKLLPHFKHDHLWHLVLQSFEDIHDHSSHTSMDFANKYAQINILNRPYQLPQYYKPDPKIYETFASISEEEFYNYFTGSSLTPPKLLSLFNKFKKDLQKMNINSNDEFINYEMLLIVSKWMINNLGSYTLPVKVGLQTAMRLQLNNLKVPASQEKYIRVIHDFLRSRGLLPDNLDISLVIKQEISAILLAHPELSSSVTEIPLHAFNEISLPVSRKVSPDRTRDLVYSAA